MQQQNKLLLTKEGIEQIKKTIMGVIGLEQFDHKIRNIDYIKYNVYFSEDNNKAEFMVFRKICFPDSYESMEEYSNKFGGRMTTKDEVCKFVFKVNKHNLNMKSKFAIRTCFYVPDRQILLGKLFEQLSKNNLNNNYPGDQIKQLEDMNLECICNFCSNNSIDQICVNIKRILLIVNKYNDDMFFEIMDKHCKKSQFYMELY